MPSPAKTTDSQIIAATRKLVERRGRDGFSMKDVAAAVGIRAPSLYGRFADRAQILALVEIGYWKQLERALSRAQRADDLIAGLVAQARAYRAFAKAHPEGYALMFDPRAERTEEGTRARAGALAPTVRGFAALVGRGDAGDEARTLLAARVLTPFLHGFVAMELVGAFRLGDGLDEAFEYGVAAILGGLRATGGRRIARFGQQTHRRARARPKRPHDRIH